MSRKRNWWSGTIFQIKLSAFHGVVETNAKCPDHTIIKTCAEELGVDIKQEDLDKSHRLGNVKRNENKPRPIIVKFGRYAVRNKVFSNKKNLRVKNY